MSKINISSKFQLFNEYWTPKVIAQANGQLVKIAKGNGELVWHKHDNEDELFIVFQGQLIIQLKTEEIVLNPGDMYVVKKGVEHCPKATTETHFMMIEPAGTAHTGNTVSDKTVSIDKQQFI